MNIPMVDLKAQYHTLKAEMDSAVLRVLEESSFIMGPDVKKLEEEVARYMGTKHAIGVGSGTEALHIALMAAGIGRDDEVAVPTFTFIATSEVVALLGAHPVFTDIDSATFAMDPADLEKKISKKTRAVIPVHLYGQSADMDRIMEIAKRHSLLVVEDCAQAQGATWKGTKVGTIGDVGCLSFFPSKNLGGYGDGGMIVTNRDDIAEKARAIRVHGSSRKYFHHLLGLNSRLDTMQAAILRVKLPHLDRWNELRRKVAAAYDKALEGTPFTAPKVAADAYHVYHQYTIRTPLRNDLQEFLKNRGVASMIYYPLSLHQQEVYQHGKDRHGSLPVAERAQDEVLSLPMCPDLTDEQIAYVIESLMAFKKERLHNVTSLR